VASRIPLTVLLAWSAAAWPGAQSLPAAEHRAASLAAPARGVAAELPLQATRRVRFDTDEGTWMSVAVSPDGRALAFDLLGDLYTLPMEGGAARPVTTGLAYDSQPAFSPDGTRLAFLSDRSGAENVWVVRVAGTHLEQISSRDDNPVFVSPTWSADGASIYVSEYHSDLNAFDLWKFEARPGGTATAVVPINTTAADNPDNRTSTVGAAASKDGRFLYYASHTGAIKLGATPEWTIKRRELASGEEETVVFANHGPRPDLNSATAFRPAVAPDGKTLVYGTHYDGATGLRLLNLETREDRWLAFPVQQDSSRPRAGATCCRATASLLTARR